jgi:hypothetical protein
VNVSTTLWFLQGRKLGWPVLTGDIADFDLLRLEIIHFNAFLVIA